MTMMIMMMMKGMMGVMMEMMRKVHVEDYAFEYCDPVVWLYHLASSNARHERMSPPFPSSLPFPFQVCSCFPVPPTHLATKSSHVWFPSPYTDLLISHCFRWDMMFV